MFVPKYKTPGSVCCDLVANIPVDDNGRRQVDLPYRAGAKIDCGFNIELPEGWKAEVSARSSWGERLLLVCNAPGQIDTDYRGRMMVMVVNVGKEIISIKHGDRIGQMWPVPVRRFEFELADELSQTERGEGGFGSTNQ